MSDFFRNIISELKDEDVNLAADGKSSGEFSSFIDTGCYMMNAAISGTIFGGMADNKVLVLAGESSTGKSFVALGIAKRFLDSDPEAAVIYYDTESAITRDMMTSRGIDVNRVIIGEPQTLQDFRTKALKFLEVYAKAPVPRPRVLMILDSLGMLSSAKEMADTSEGKDTKDMTKAQLIRGIFRVLRLKLSKLHIPMIVTAHTYASIGCMIGETLVKMDGGYAVPISEIQVGDVVETLVGPKPVSVVYRYEDAETFDLELEDGSLVTVTGEHKFLRQDMEWVKARDLLEGDTIVSLQSLSHGLEVNSMKPLKIVRKNKNTELQTVHDIGVDDAHHYILENGIISHNSYVPSQEISGGSGAKYASDSIAMLRKSKDKEGTEIVGVFMKIMMYKSRLSRENQHISAKLSYNSGLDRYYGLLDFCEETGVVKREGNKYVFPLIPDKKFFRKAVESEPKLFWTPEMLKIVDAEVRKHFQYGGGGEAEIDHDPEEEEENDAVPENLRVILSAAAE